MKKLSLFLVALTMIVFSCKPEVEKPTVVTKSVGEVTETTAKVVGQVTFDGGSDVTERGVCWSTSPAPEIIDYRTKDAECGLGTYELDVTNLKDNTQYYVRAYATNEKGTAYGEEVSFTTEEVKNLEQPVEPVVITAKVTDITLNSAVCGGEVVSGGDAVIVARGVCYNTTGVPTVSDIYTMDGTNIGNFTSILSNLESNTTYYVRAYATNTHGVTAYGEEVSFKTLEKLLPEVTTAEVTNITESSATCGGDVTFDGNVSVIAKGICWSTSQNPTIDDNKTTDGSGVGSFKSNIPNLLPNTQYYVRAYATNVVGTSYGDELSFTTLSACSIVEELPDYVLPSEIYNEVTKYLPIYSGINPPTITGEYVSSPHALIYESYAEKPDSLQFYSDRYMGFIYTNKQMNFYGKQYDSLNHKYIEEIQYNVKITGSNDLFTCYYVVDGYVQGYYAQQSFIFSGKKTATGLEDFHIAVVLLETSGNPNMYEKHSYRVLKDYDGLAETNNWLSGKSSTISNVTKGNNTFDIWMK